MRLVKCAILSILLLLPSLFLVYIKYVNTFFWWALSSASLALNIGYLAIEFPLQPAYETILYSISGIGGLNGLQLAIIPLGSVIIPICYFAISKSILKSNIMATLLILNIAYDFSIYGSDYSTFAYTWTNILFFSFILVYLSYLRNNGSSKYIIPLYLIFLATYYMHPTYTAWIMLFVLYFSVFVIVAKELNFKIDSGSYLNLALVFFLIYIGFNKAIYKIYLRKIISEEQGMVYEFISTIKSFLGLSRELPEKYALQSAPPNQLLGYSSFARTFVILVILSVIIFIWIKNNHKNISKIFNRDLVLIGALLMVGISHLVAYGLYGHMSVRFITLIYPIVIVWIMQKIYIRKTIQIAFLAILIFLGVVQTVSFGIQNYDISNDISEYSIPGSFWLFNKGYDSSRILSDYETSQIFYFYFKSENHIFVQRFYDSKVYDMLVNSIENEKLKYTTDYIIINNRTANNPTSFRGWKYYESLSKYMKEIDYNTKINKIYDDNNIWTFITR